MASTVVTAASERGGRASGVRTAAHPANCAGSTCRIQYWFSHDPRESPNRNHKSKHRNKMERKAIEGLGVSDRVCSGNGQTELAAWSLEERL